MACGLEKGNIEVMIFCTGDKVEFYSLPCGPRQLGANCRNPTVDVDVKSNDQKHKQTKVWHFGDEVSFLGTSE